MKILAFGEVLWDVYPDKKFIGGASLNFAAHLVLHGAEATILSSVGGDALGREAIEALDSHGIRTDRVSVLDSKLTGQSIVTLNEAGVPSYNVLSDVAYDYIKCGVDDGEKFDSLYFGTLSLRSVYNRESIKEVLRRGIFREIFVDLNIRAPHSLPENIRFAMKNASILKISDEELPSVLLAADIPYSSDFEQVMRSICEKYPNVKILILTLGEKGAMAYSVEENALHTCKAKKTDVASTVGAGDSFSASFLHKYLSGAFIDEALEHASRVSAYVVSKTEAVPVYPESFD